MPHDPRQDALAAWFLGPRAENADLLERLITEALRDHVFWRRNYHPEDGFTIREIDKRSESYGEAIATLKQELMGLLAQLKSGVPFFSGRYKGHMAFEQTIAAQVGYFAAMLYNPNNVATEASPVTTRLELEVAADLARMIGYDPRQAWGHLTSGGTVANFEALWIARNISYLPLAILGAAEVLGVTLQGEHPDGTRAPLDTLTLSELLNITVPATLDLWQTLWAAAPHDDVKRAVSAHSLATLGYQDYDRLLRLRYPDPLPASVVLVAATAHYSWEKIVRALGIGSNQIVFVPVDTRYRMDPDALWSRVRDLTKRRVPIMACVSVCGTTEESSVDRLDHILEVRARAEQELGVTFHLHADACYGGYAAAVTWNEDGTRRSAAEIRRSAECAWPDEEWVRAIESLGEMDSVTIDPHKLGYVPYPAGVFLLRDRRGRELVTIDPPYLEPAQGLGNNEDLFLGRFIFEGSKPGAAAAAVWLSHKVLPLDKRGYGYLIERTVRGARELHAALCRAPLDPFRLILLPEPDINIVCYVIHHPSLTTLEAVNAFNERVYEKMSLGALDSSPAYIITRTRFQTPMYDGAIDPLLDTLGVATEDEWRQSGAEGLVVLRSTVMDPWLGAPPPGPDHVAGYTAALHEACKATLSERESALSP